MATTLGSTDQKQSIAIAADVRSLSDLTVLLAATAGNTAVRAVKVGFSLVLRHGLPAVVSTVRAISQVSVIYDHQKAGTDIPQMGKPYAETCRESGVDAVIIFPQSGPRTLEAFVTGALQSNLIPIVGLTMTHPGYLAADEGYLIDTAPELICKRALELGVTHFVLPGNKPSVVRDFSIGLFKSVRATIWMPGIGSQGGSLSRALESAHPHDAVGIIGSAIYGSADPRGILSEFSKEIAS